MCLIGLIAHPEHSNVLSAGRSSVELRRSERIAVGPTASKAHLGGPARRKERPQRPPAARRMVRREGRAALPRDRCLRAPRRAIDRHARIKDDNAFEQIPAAFAALEQCSDLSDDGRPWFEFYIRHDQVDALVPVR